MYHSKNLFIVLIQWIILPIWFTAVAFNSVCFADQETESLRLIDAYVQAVEEDDPARIKSSWNALNQDEEAKTYMQINMPKLAYLFRVRGLYLQLQELQSDRSKLFDEKKSTDSIDRSVQAFRSDLSSQAVKNVEKFSLSEDDPSRRTNRDIVMAAQGRQLQDNRSIALSNPNQNRIGNVQYIKNRVDALYSGKFQESPEELAPRGNTFPKSRPEATVDVRIQGGSSEVTVRRVSRAEATIGVFLNGRVIESGLDLGAGEGAFKIYLEPGKNILKFTLADRSIASRVSLDVFFSQVVGDQNRFNFEVNSAESRDLNIEALP